MDQLPVRYDPLKQVTDVFDARNNHTTADYDLLGRRTVLDNPDTGKVVMEFNLAGKLTQKDHPIPAMEHTYSTVADTARQQHQLGTASGR